MTWILWGGVALVVVVLAAAFVLAGSHSRNDPPGRWDETSDD